MRKVLYLATALTASLSASHVMAASSIPATTNPNLTEWKLINLTSTQTTAANNGLGVKVAVLDSLADCRHVELAGRCSNLTFTGGSYNYYGSHGTHTSGIVASKKYGVATSATILNYAVFDDNGWFATGTRLVTAWRDAYARGARISSMSFGCTGLAYCFSASEVTAMADATRPMLYVKAAGNDTKALASEYIGVSKSTALAAINRTIIVGSVDLYGNISSFSNTAGNGCLMYSGATSCIADMQWKNHFIVAPGQSIYSTLPGNMYGYMSGTSMATPVVAGAAALMLAKWPTLTPENVATILFQTATDKGAAGTDTVYGRGLLNVASAFAANGKVTVQTTAGTTTTTGTSTVTSGTTGSKIGTALGSVTVYDSFGRDYTLAEAGGLQTRQSAYAVRQMLGRKQLALGPQDDWADSLFAPAQAPHGYAYFGSAASASVAGDLDQSLRMGVDMPFKAGAAQFRFTGSSDARFDFANDASLKPLALFASTGLIRNALFGNALINVGKNSRLMVYSTTTTGAMNGQMSESAMDRRLVEAGMKAPQLALTRTGREQKQSGFGVGYWLRPADGTVIGLNASLLEQKGGWYDLVANIGGFEKKTRLYNAGAAVSQTLGKWELTGSGEVTRLVTGGQNLAVHMSNATLASAELTLRRNGLFASTPGKRDSLALALVLPPTPVSGKLMLDYMTRTADGLGKQAVNRAIPLSQLGFEPARIEAAYKFELGKSLSLALSGGANLKTVDYAGKGDVMASVKLAF